MSPATTSPVTGSPTTASPATTTPTASPATDSPVTTCPTSTVGPTAVPTDVTSSPITDTPVTVSPATTGPTTSPITTAPSMYYEYTVDENADPDSIPQVCPHELMTKNVDAGTFYYKDLLGELYELVTPNKADNAGFYLSDEGGWNRIPKVIPEKSDLIGKTYAVGNSTVKFMLYDQFNNQKECLVTVQVIDNEEPEFLNCPPPMEVEADEQCLATATWNTPRAIDNDPHGATVDTPIRSPGATFSMADGAFDIGYHAQDAAGEGVDCNFTVTVIDKMDPYFLPGLCKADKQMYTEKCGRVGQETGVEVSFACPATDNCDGDSVTVQQDMWIEITGKAKFHPTHPSTVSCDDFSHSTMMAAKASCAGFAYCYIKTNSSGSICASPMSHVAEEVTLSATNQLFIYQPADNMFPIPPSDDGAPTHYKVSFTATDAAQNSVSQSLTFTVVDGRSSPAFVRCPTGPIYRNLSTEFGETTITGGFSPPLHTTSCDTTMSEASGWDHNTQLSEGNKPFYYTAEDAYGNTAECRFDVIVRDINELYWVDCPLSDSTDINVITDPTLLQYAIVDWPVPKVYKRGVEMTQPNITINYPDVEPGLAFPLGVTPVVYTVTDARLGVYVGVRTPPTCKFYVTVNDIERPKFTGWATREQCQEGEDVGVPRHEFCGGKYINIEKYNGNFKLNNITSVTEETFQCCNVGTSCKVFGDSKVSFCQD